MRTILLTGFGRFPGSPVNPSGVVAARLAKHRRPALAGTRRVAHVFATRYDAVDRELPMLLAREKPDILVMFGVAGRSRQVRIEERARNRVALFPDAGRRRPVAQTIALHHDARLNPLPLARLVTAARSAGVAAARSPNAGSYLCNYAYWRGLEAAARPDGPAVVIFVHVPPVAIKPVAIKETPKRPLNAKPLRRSSGRRPKPVPRKRRAPGINDLVRAGEAVVLAMIPLAAQTSIPPATQTPIPPTAPTPIPPPATQTPSAADSGPLNPFSRPQPSRWRALARRVFAAGRRFLAVGRRD
jgi:pyroglutamyl-peptidase